MVRRIAAVTLAAATLTLGLAACGSDQPTTSPGGQTTTTTTSAAASGGGDATAWAEKVCTAVAPEVKALSTQPNIDPTDPAKAKDGMVAYLDTMVKAFERMITGIEGAGTPPVTDGEEAAKRVTSALGEAKSVVATAKDNLAKVSTTDMAAFQAGFAKVAEDLQKLGQMEDPTKGLRGNKELDKAFEDAPACKALDAATGSGATPTT